MEYAALVETYERLAATDSTLERTRILADRLADTDPDVLGMVVGTVRGSVYEPWENAELGLSSSLTVEAIETATGIDTDRIESVWSDTGDLGDTAAWALENRTQQPLVSETLTLTDVHDTLRELAEYEGQGSQRRRVDEVAGLLSDADPAEARYVVRTALGHMRLGVGDGTMRDAIAEAFLDGSEAAVEAVERAHQVTNDYRLVAETARTEGREGLAELDLELFRPVRVMLATKAEGLDAGIESVAPETGSALLEYKYDGARVQVHKDGETVRIYTRRLEEVTEQFPEVVEAVRAQVGAERCLLDGELVGHDPETGEPVPFQEFSRRIKRKYDIETLAAETPATCYLFDLLYHEDTSLLETTLAERLERLTGAFEPAPGDIERAEQCRPDEGSPRSFYESALETGHEGVMVKNLGATYQPGTRVGYMMKVKPVMEPLDLVVTRAQYSEGRRSDYLGRLVLACRNGEAFAEVGRLSTGYTDAELATLSERLESLVVAEDGRMVELEPAVVLEVEYEEIQESPEYDSGYALRFPRYLDTRRDLSPADADSLERVRRLYDQQ